MTARQEAPGGDGPRGDGLGAACLAAMGSAVDPATAEKAVRILESPAPRGGYADVREVDDALVPLERVLAATPPGPLRTTLLSNLGLLHTARFQLSAEPPDLKSAVLYLREAQETQVRNPEHPALSAAIPNLIGALLTLADVTGDADYLDEAVARGRDAAVRLPPGLPQRASVLASLSSALRVRYERTRYEGDLTEAVELGRRAAADLAPRSPQRGQVLSSLGNLLLTADRPEESAEMYGQALAAFRAVADEGGCARTLNNLAGALSQAGRHAEAVELYREALAAFEALGDRAGTGRALTNLAGAVSRLGRHAEAAALHRRALRVRTAVHGPDHPDTLRSTAGLAHAVAATGDLDEAEELHARALAGYERTLGAHHPLARQAREALAAVRERRAAAAQREGPGGAG